MHRPEQVQRLQEAARDVEYYETSGLTGPRYQQAKALFQAVKRNASTSEWVTARATYRGDPNVWC